ncbi:MAG: nucleoside recognition protein [Blautia sp.]
MMNYLWGGMILLGLIYGVFAGTLDAVTESVINSAREAVSLVISIAGITAFWTGIMKIAEQAGLVEKLAKRTRPLLSFLFPELKNQEKANYYISLNFLSNFLGLSHASTSSGLLAFQELDRLNGHSTIASRSMCTFLIINVSSLQLLPINIIAYRAQYGSPAPAAIVGPAIFATGMSTLAAVVFCKIMNGNRRPQ